MRPRDFLTAGINMAGTGLVGLRTAYAPPSPCSKTNSASPPISFDVAAYARILQQMTKLYPYDPAAVAASISALGQPSHLPLTFNGNNMPSPIGGNLSSNSSVKSDNFTSNLSIKEETATKRESPTTTCEKALDLSTQGLKSIYSHYKRITMDQIKPKIVEDTWVENDLILGWTDSKIAAYNPAQKLFMCVDCECVGFLSRVAEHWLGAHANLRVFHCPRCPYTSAWSRCVKMHLTRQHNEQFADTTMWKENATLLEVTKLMQELRTKVETKIDSSNMLADKRFYCPHCPYATDRRDLYTRHENIHKDNKPFHCYICFKQFNRADHVKKHFVRMHPESEYDISKIRKQPTASKPHNSPPISNESKSPSQNTWDKKHNLDQNENSSSSSNNELSTKANSLSSSLEIIVTTIPEQVSKIPVVDLTPIDAKGSLPLEKAPNTEGPTRSRRRGDRAYTCHYCHWSGSDNWCLKRHMNTHIKPFGCIMCDYKAARAERLSTHVWKVHNKRICNKCNFLADTQERLLEHTREEHHNNPYSRRHICGSCGMSFDTRANLETHIHLTHTRPKSPNDIVQITPISVSETDQVMAQDLSMRVQFPTEESLSLICPIENCSMPCESSGVLADHVRQEHGGLFASRCPHCSYNLTQDELAKDHWLTHHEDVCNACVHIFTSVYGPQLWKKVHVNQQNNESSLDAIVTGLNKKRVEPLKSTITQIGEMSLTQDGTSSISSHSSPSSPANSEVQDPDERYGKRKRKQSCPKKVIVTATSDSEEWKEDDDNSMEVFAEESQVKAQVPFKKRKLLSKKCLRCPHHPTFSSVAKLLEHKRLRHNIIFRRRPKTKRHRSVTKITNI